MQHPAARRKERFFAESVCWQEGLCMPSMDGANNCAKKVCASINMVSVTLVQSLYRYVFIGREHNYDSDYLC